jgi:hypothetical protein
MSMTTRRSFMAQTATALAASSLGAATVGATGCAPSAACVAAVRNLMGSKLDSFISVDDTVLAGPLTLTLSFDGHGFQAALSEIVQRFGAADVMLALGGD